ncbi:MAG: gas vesicle protein GvpG [Isosphaeraceae bacterium]
MLLVDDVALFPFKSILMVFREIYNAAIQELEQEGERIRLELSQLYISLESGAIDEATFDERERVLLDRLDVLEAQESEEGDGGGAEEGPALQGEEDGDVDGDEEGEEDGDVDDDEEAEEDDSGPYVYLPSSDS